MQTEKLMPVDFSADIFGVWVGGLSSLLLKMVGGARHGDQLLSQNAIQSLQPEPNKTKQRASIPECQPDICEHHHPYLGIASPQLRSFYDKDTQIFICQ